MALRRSAFALFGLVALAAPAKAQISFPPQTLTAGQGILLNGNTISATTPTPTDGGAPISAAQAVTTVQGAGIIPTPIVTIPPAPTAAGLAGSGLTYIPGNAAVMTLCRRTATVTDSSGNFTVTWAIPLVSLTPWADVGPVWNSTTTPPICWVMTASNTVLTGHCLATTTTALNLTIVTAGLTLSPFSATQPSALPVKVHSCEPSQ